MSLRRNRDLSGVEESEDLFVSQPRVKKKCISNSADVLQDDSVFGQLVSGAGYILKKGDQPNMLSEY